MRKSLLAVTILFTLGFPISECVGATLIELARDGFEVKAYALGWVILQKGKKVATCGEYGGRENFSKLNCLLFE